MSFPSHVSPYRCVNCSFGAFACPLHSLYCDPPAHWGRGTWHEKIFPHTLPPPAQWESIVNTTAERVEGKKVVRCGVSVKWWDDELQEEIGARKQYLSEGSELGKYRAKKKQVRGL